MKSLNHDQKLKLCSALAVLLNTQRVDTLKDNLLSKDANPWVIRHYGVDDLISTMPLELTLGEEISFEQCLNWVKDLRTLREWNHLTVEKGAELFSQTLTRLNKTELLQ
jgi:hypothetical protein